MRYLVHTEKNESKPDLIS